MFQFFVGAMVAAHQMRSTGTGAVTLCAFAQSLDHARIGGKPEVVVAAEREIFASVHPKARALGAVVDAAAAAQALRLERGKLSEKVAHRIRLISGEAPK
jgi:hypothetical protein